MGKNHIQFMSAAVDKGSLDIFNADIISYVN